MEEWKVGDFLPCTTAILWSERPEANFLRLAKALHLSIAPLQISGEAVLSIYQ